jgi:hypothetical protein
MHFFEAKRSSLVRQSSRFPSACPRVVPCGRDASYNRGYSFIGRKLVQLFFYCCSFYYCFTRLKAGWWFVGVLLLCSIVVSPA